MRVGYLLMRVICNKEAIIALNNKRRNIREGKKKYFAVCRSDSPPVPKFISADGSRVESSARTILISNKLIRKKNNIKSMGSIRTLPLAITIESISIFSFSFLNKKKNGNRPKRHDRLAAQKKEGNVT